MTTNPKKTVFFCEKNYKEKILEGPRDPKPI